MKSEKLVFRCHVCVIVLFSVFFSLLILDLRVLCIFLVCNNSNYFFALMGQKERWGLHETFQRNEKKRSTLNYKEIQRRTKQKKTDVGKKGKHTKKSDNFFSSSKSEPENWKMERIWYRNVHGRTERRTNNGTTELYMSNSSSFQYIFFFSFPSLDFKSIRNFRHCVYRSE